MDHRRQVRSQKSEVRSTKTADVELQTSDFRLLERELEKALAVDPSPAFLARVRTRIAHESAPRAWRISSVMCCAGAAIVAVPIVYAVALMPTRRTTPAAPSHSLAATSLPYVASGFSRTSPYVASAFRRTSDGPAKAGRHVHGQTVDTVLFD